MLDCCTPNSQNSFFMRPYASLNLKCFSFLVLYFLIHSVCEKNNRILCTDTRAVGLQSGRYILRRSILHSLNKAAPH